MSVNAGLRHVGCNDEIRVPHKRQRVRKAHNVSVNKGNVSGCKVQDSLEKPFVARKLIPDRRETKATRSSPVRCATVKCRRASRVFVCHQGVPVNDFGCHPPHSAYCDPLVGDAQHPASTLGATTSLKVKNNVRAYSNKTPWP